MSASGQDLIPLSLRGESREIPREAFAALPESIVICLFPNGFMQQRKQLANGTFLDEFEEIYVDVRASIPGLPASEPSDSSMGPASTPS
jgi:hypothetical protein